jgi:hypothetical protein
MKTFRIVLLVVGIFLLGLNISGLFISLRNPALNTEKNTGRVHDVTLSYDQTKKEIKRKPGESDKDFAVRLTGVVANSMSHYWKNEGLKKYNMQIPAWDNYILYTASLFKKDKRYEYKHYKKDLERGVGLCSTHSIVLKGILLHNGIEAYLWDIDGHVVVRAKVGNNEWYILDPDFGLIVPHDIAEIEGDPEIVRPVYASMAGLYKKDYDHPYTADQIIELYGKKGNHIYDYNMAFENFADIGIWIIPFLLMIPFFTIGKGIKK